MAQSLALTSLLKEMCDDRGPEDGEPVSQDQPTQEGWSGQGECILELKGGERCAM